MTLIWHVVWRSGSQPFYKISVPPSTTIICAEYPSHIRVHVVKNKEFTGGHTIFSHPVSRPIIYDNQVLLHHFISPPARSQETLSSSQPFYCWSPLLTLNEQRIKKQWLDTAKGGPTPQVALKPPWTRVPSLSLCRPPQSLGLYRCEKNWPLEIELSIWYTHAGRGNLTIHTSQCFYYPLLRMEWVLMGL